MRKIITLLACYILLFDGIAMASDRCAVVDRNERSENSLFIFFIKYNFKYLVRCQMNYSNLYRFYIASKPSLDKGACLYRSKDIFLTEGGEWSEFSPRGMPEPPIITFFSRQTNPCAPPGNTSYVPAPGLDSKEYIILSDFWEKISGSELLFNANMPNNTDKYDTDLIGVIRHILFTDKRRVDIMEIDKKKRFWLDILNINRYEIVLHSDEMDATITVDQGWSAFNVKAVKRMQF